MKEKSLLTKNIIRVLSANFIQVVVGFVGSFIFPKILSIDSYAYYQSFILYLGYLNIIHLGFPSGMTVKYAGKSHKEIDKGQYKAEFLIIWSVISFFGVAFLLFGFIVNNKMIIYLGISIFPVIFTNIYKSLYQAWNEFKIFTRISIFTTVLVPVVAIAIYLCTGDLTGEQYVITYIAVYAIIFTYIFINEVLLIHGSASKKIISSENIKTEKIGFALLIGNYINLLFGSVDKQFVNSFFTNKEFAYYSFAISLQSIMTIFITSLSQPLFPALASGNVSDNDHNLIKEILIVLGSFSGCAYFAASIIVKMFITKYIGSIEIIGIYFVIFPALAIVNCLYINLYKIKGKMKQYIATLIGMLVLAIVLDYSVVVFKVDFKWIALATVIVYYTWLFVGSRQFDTIFFTMTDVLYFVLFFGLFFATSTYLSDVIGLLVYFLLNIIMLIVLYRKTMIYIFSKVVNVKNKEKISNE